MEPEELAKRIENGTTQTNEFRLQIETPCELNRDEVHYIEKLLQNGSLIDGLQMHAPVSAVTDAEQLQIWVARIGHRHGTDVYAAYSHEGILKQAAAYVAEWFQNENLSDREVYQIRTALFEGDYQEAISVYFDAKYSETIDIMHPRATVDAHKQKSLDTARKASSFAEYIENQICLYYRDREQMTEAIGEDPSLEELRSYYESLLPEDEEEEEE